ncbi:unnamed protein product [Peniophora sp. CBMAI 1063]|nr:unnamed protein product [Peniophora sp. CBMAI 1063]
MRENAQTGQAWVQGGLDRETRNARNTLGCQIINGPAAVKNLYESHAKKQSLEKARLESAQLAAQAVKELGLGFAAPSQDTGASGDAVAAPAGEAPAVIVDGFGQPSPGAVNDLASAMINFVMCGLKIEALQLRASRAKANNTILQKTERLEEQTQLERQIYLFRKDQQWIMPLVFAAVQELQGVESSRAMADDKDEDTAVGDQAKRTAVLYLPSELDRDLARTPTLLKLLHIELKLRYDGMEDWLDILR